jgi:hypothetical protein
MQKFCKSKLAKLFKNNAYDSANFTGRKDKRVIVQHFYQQELANLSYLPGKMTLHSVFPCVFYHNTKGSTKQLPVVGMKLISANLCYSN